ncbi:hypothetical protein Tco_1438718 [Tanacetum coccineum]
MNLLSFIRTADPMKVKVGERQRADDEPWLLETTVGHVVPLLPVAPARTSGELEASVERLFGEGDGGEHVEHSDSAGGGQGVDIQPVIATADTIGEHVEHSDSAGGVHGFEPTVGLSVIFTGYEMTALRMGEPLACRDHHRVRICFPLLPGGQGDSAGGGQGVDIQPVIATADTIVEDVAPLQPMRRKKRKIVAADASGPSHPPKKLREDYGYTSGPSVAGKPRSAFQRLLVGAVLNAENPADSMTGPNLRTISAPQRFVISSDSSHHSGANIAEAEVDSVVRSSTPIIATVVTTTVDAAATAKEAPVRPSLFGVGSSSAGGIDPTPGGFSDVSGSDFLIGGICTVVEPNFDLQKVYVPQWSVTNGSRLDDDRVCREMLDEFAPLKFFASIRGMKHDQLFTEFNVGAARQVSLSAEVRMRAEYNIKEKRKLRAVVEEMDILLKAKGEEVDSLKAQLLVKEAKAAEAIRLRAEASKFEVVEKSLRAEASKFEVVEKSLRDELESLKKRNITLEKEKSVLDVRVSDLAATVKVKEQEATDSDAMVTAVKLQNNKLADQEPFDEFQDVQMRMVGDKLAKLEVDLSEMTLHFEEKFYPHLLTTIVGRRWLLTHGLKLFLIKCLNSSEYLSALGAAISRAIKKGMQDGLAAGIEHGAHGRSLEDLVAYNLFTEEDYNAALQELRSLDFPLLTELKSHKDASVETIMNLLRLESPLVDALGMSDLQPDVDQLMVPIHRSKDQAVLGSTSLLFALSVTRDRVERIRKNIVEHRSALTGVYVPLVESLSIAALESVAGTSGTVPDTTTALSVTFASASTTPISTDDYEIVHTDGQEGTNADGLTSTGADANPFLGTDDAELNVLE